MSCNIKQLVKFFLLVSQFSDLGLTCCRAVVTLAVTGVMSLCSVLAALCAPSPMSAVTVSVMAFSVVRPLNIFLAQSVCKVLMR